MLQVVHLLEMYLLYHMNSIFPVCYLMVIAYRLMLRLGRLPEEERTLR